MLCDYLDGWDVVGCGVGRRQVLEEGDTFIHIANSLCVQQKLTQHCKAIILQGGKKADVVCS